MTFAGKVVLVTGGTSGLGRATALSFARKGAAVVIAGRSAERGEAALTELRALTTAAEFVRADVSRAGEVERLLRHTVERFGRLDCAVNNAGVLDDGVFKIAADYTEDEFDRHLAANLKSVWLCMKHEIAEMLAQGRGGAIVNTSSINGLGGAAQSAPYAVAKAGVISLTKTAALEYAKRGIRINAIVPGAFRTPMLESVFERMSPDDPAKAASRYAGLSPLGRIGEPGEAAEAAVWLCSSESSFVVGHALVVDGGVTVPFR